jgi:DNA repair exonuclease SbcCD ATPase subunit
MRITELKIKNFKGIAHLERALGHLEVIEGPNGAGKTSILDSICWILYGTDSQGNKEFPVKPVNLAGTGVIVSVELVCQLEQEEVTLRKELHEQLDGEGNLKGNTYKYFLDGLPLTAKAWEDWITKHLPRMWQLRISPLALGSLHWKERRKALAQLVDFARIEKEVRAKYKVYGDFEALKTKLRAEIQKFEESIAQFQPRIDEARVVNSPEVVWTTDDEAQLQNLSAGINAQLEKRAAVHQKLLAERQKLSQLQQQARKQAEESLAAARKAAEEPLREFNERMATLTSEHRSINIELSEVISLAARRETQYNELNKKLEQLRLQFLAAQGDNLTCPVFGITCQTSAAVEKMTADKEVRLAKISQLGSEVRKKTDELLEEIDHLNKRIKSLKEKQAEVEAKIATLAAEKPAKKAVEIPPVEIPTTTPEIEALEKQLAALEISTPQELDELKAKKAAAKNYQAAVKKAKERVEALKNEWRLQGAELLERQKALRYVESCEQEIADRVEEGVNAHFTGICRWQMFKRFINGGMAPDCQLYVEDKPWEALNHGLQVMTGLKIITRVNDILQDEPLPVLIDNAESTTGLQNLDVNFQLILTYVKPS